MTINYLFLVFLTSNKTGTFAIELIIMWLWSVLTMWR